MRRVVITALTMVYAAISFAQIGIGTTTPNSTLDVRGSLAINYRAFTSSTTAGTDYTLVFTGISAATLTLPDATTVTGRVYWIKNASANASTLTIATTSSQTIDGASSWSLAQTNKVVAVVSNGTDWYTVSESVPGNSSGSAWVLGGNSLSSIQNLGTISSHDLPFITNGTEKMRLTTGGNLGVGTSTFNGTNPERLIVDAGANGSGAFQNVIVGKGSTNSYAQLNIQNTYSAAGNSASSDVVATSDNGNETVNYVDMGINSGTNTSAGIYGGGNTAYLYSTGNDFAFGNATASKNLLLFTGGTASGNERMRISGTGNVGIANTSPSEKLDVTGNLKFSGALMPGGSAGAVGTFLVSTGSGSAPTWFDASGYAWLVGGNSVSSEQKIGTISNFALPFITDNTERMRISNTGNVAIGVSSFSGTYPERLIVNAGSPATAGDYQNVIVGKGNTNSYAQLNIQNTYSAAGNSASSDVVATSDNGNESVNYIDMGINSGTNTSGGIYGGNNTAYLYSTGNDFVVGNGAANKNLIFFTGGTATTNEKLRLTGNGITVTGSVTVSYHSGSGNYTLAATDYVVINTGAAATWTLPAANTCAGRVYKLINHGTGAISLSLNVSTTNAATVNSIATGAASNYMEIMSDGTVWRKIN